MANELVHATQGASLTQAEFEAVGLHIFDSQSTGDIPYASSTTQISRLAITAARILGVSGGIPAWVNTLPAMTLGGAITGGDQTMTQMGHIGIARAVSTNFGLAYGETITITDNADKGGALFNFQPAKTSAAFTAQAWGGKFAVQLDSTNTQNWTHATAGLIGVLGDLTIEGASSGTVTGAANFITAVNVLDAATITNLYGFYIVTPTVAGSKVTNEYGIYIADQNTGATLNYAIYTNAGVVRIGDDIHLPATKKLYFDGGTHTYIDEVSADRLEFVAGGTAMLTIASSWFAIPATGRFYFDNGGDTYIAETAADKAAFVVGGTKLFELTEAGGGANDWLAINALSKLYIDGGGNTYIHESAADTMGFVMGGVAIATITATAINIGVAGATAGTLTLAGSTSGVVTIAVAAAAGTWTMTLPAAVGGAGEQLTDAAGNGVTSWAAAASSRKWKNDLGPFDPQYALDQILGTRDVHLFTYKAGHGTGDYKTKYVGPFAEDAPWAMHFGNTIVNPVNTLGYMVLGFKAMDARFSTAEERIAAVEEANRILREQLVDAKVLPKA